MGDEPKEPNRKGLPALCSRYGNYIQDNCFSLLIKLLVLVFIEIPRKKNVMKYAAGSVRILIMSEENHLLKGVLDFVE